MFSNILVPLDGSKLAEAAVGAASAIAARYHGEVTLLHVSESNPPKRVHGEPHLSGPEEAESYLQSIANVLESNGIRCHWHVHRGTDRDVAESIALHEQELEPDLIVICSHGTGASGRIFIGSIGQRIAGFAAVPILIVHPEWTPSDGAFPTTSILVPLDGVAAHEAGVPIATDLAREQGGTVRLVLIVPTLATTGGRLVGISKLMPGGVIRSLDLQAGSGGEYIETKADAVKRQGVNATAEVLRGDPSRKVVGVAESWPADLVILATHGKEGLRALWSGSVAHRVCSYTRVPVLLVPVSG